MLRSAESRLALALLNLAQSFELEAQQVVHVTPHLSLLELAGITGLDAEIISLCLNNLAVQGVIGARRRRLVLWDRPALERLALGAAA